MKASDDLCKDATPVNITYQNTGSPCLTGHGEIYQVILFQVHLTAASCPLHYNKIIIFGQSAVGIHNNFFKLWFQIMIIHGIHLTQDLSLKDNLCTQFG